MTDPDDIRTCAFCPNICRALYPVEGVEQRETMAPSALAYLAYAVTKGYVAPTPEVLEALRRLEAIEVCRPACAYGFDIPASLRRLTDTLEAV